MKGTRGSGRVSRGVTAMALLAMLGMAGPAALAQQAKLGFFKNYFVTGDYVAAGVALQQKGVNGIATGRIRIEPSQIPADAEIVAAFLYFQIISTSDKPDPAMLLKDARFKGNPIGDYAFLVSDAGSAPCWSSGGGTGASNGLRRAWSYRVDALRYFPRRLPSSPTDPVTVAIGGDHEVQLPDSGGSNQLPQALGAGLVVVYRVTGYDPAAGYRTPRHALRSIVIYDGGQVMDNSTRQFVLPVEGFYEAARSSHRPRMTHMVANGQTNKSEVLRIRSTASAADNVTVATNPFNSAGGFDVATFAGNALEAGFVPGAMKATVTVDPGTSGSFDCLNWTAVVVSTDVQDTDGDGLLDVWESQSEWSSQSARLRDVYSSWPLTDPRGEKLPNLQAMAASPTVQDVFVQLDYMKGADGHTHLPKRSTLLSVASALRNAAPRPFLVEQKLCKVDDPRGACPINVHFDVGSRYAPTGACTPGSTSCEFVPAPHAVGGYEFPEQICREEVGCPFTGNPPGVVPWKSGFRQIRDARDQGGLGSPRFPENRKDIFRYGLLAHSLALRSITEPGKPRRTSGIADSGGGDFMLTLGRWDNQTGSDFVQGATLLHELGHLFGLRHGGNVPNSAVEPNCKPNYQSVMNYLFQVRGLMNAQGVPSIDFSRQLLPALSEGALGEAAGLGAATEYLPRWYAPAAGSFIDRALNTAPATRLCDGSPIPTDSLGTPLPGFDYVRVDADPRRGSAIDWNGDGDTVDTVAQNINFDAVRPESSPSVNQALWGANDFSTMDLRQTGSRRSVGSRSLSYSVVDPLLGRAPDPDSEPSVGGPLSLSVGYGELGNEPMNFADLGYGELGYGELGYGELGYGELGYGELGFGDRGYGELGYGELGVPADVDDPLSAGGDLDLDTAGSLANAPSALTAVALKGKGGIQLAWQAPAVGSVVRYEVYRVTGASVTETNIAARVLVASLSGSGSSPPATATTDTTGSLKNNTTYTYFVTAKLVLLTDCGSTPCPTTQSGVSNFATVTY